ncbi:choline ABC transporter substrate-binding protein [Pseudomonas panipatensis]|uniref:Glycine betaine/proline transport system substrate-binding protein n=1 Tax=Pseudomonas panipatensis TaxID=428992 RepID=A0A1G8M5C2_9PSED|nr:choline ABC transporter substrate-binding protein [Pseudomonas panipatensis]SDI63095.1 glycine betaine/proline transport system substrate-binding protein [Pseudomonas panipatensis]SMP47650.1 glycine betaine/proline transport system substrate-binding protein [Pseudomonas panipatensis]
MKRLMSLLFALSALSPALSSAAEADSCSMVRFADVGWTDITVTTAVTRLVLSSQGYRTQVERLSVPDTYKAMADKRIDVFLGNWMPSMANDIKPYADKGSVQTVRANLEGAKYTLAVPQYAYDAGLKSFADIAKFKDQLGGKIYGIEPGNDGNQLIKKMIADKAFGLGDFQLVESNEGDMLASVKRAGVLKQPIVFLGWEPHPMNTRLQMHYLEGGDTYFGPNYGGATVYTNVRAGYLEECPNVARLLHNLQFNLDMENHLMDAVLNERNNPRQAAKEWLKANPQMLEGWLKGVQPRAGGMAKAVASE